SAARPPEFPRAVRPLRKSCIDTISSPFLMRTRAASALVLTAILLLLAELGTRTAFFVRDRVKGSDYRVHADALASAPWRERYFAELEASSRAEWRPYVAWRSQRHTGEFINIDDRGV